MHPSNQTQLTRIHTGVDGTYELSDGVKGKFVARYKFPDSSERIKEKSELSGGPTSLVVNEDVVPELRDGPVRCGKPQSLKIATRFSLKNNAKKTGRAVANVRLLDTQLVSWQLQTCKP